jgi:predicted SprT family Zn-dependent metalloprotease
MNTNDAEALALLYMDEHGLFDELWHFTFEACKRTLGRCHYYTKKITLSKWYVELNDEDDVEDTILHEIAHALSFLRYGTKGKGHGRLWKNVCKEIGARPERLHKGILEYPNNHYKYSDTCGCDITYQRHRVRKNAKYRCPKCNEPLFNHKEKKDWLSSMRSADALLKDILECA